MPAVSRQGDSVISPDGSGYKCQMPLETSVGQVNSNNVYANSILIVVAGNTVSPHAKSGCSTDESTLSSYSSTVHVGGMGMGRIGDAYGNNTITQGSPSVFAS